MKLRLIMIGVAASLGLCSCGDDESSASPENPESKRAERPPRPGSEGNRKSSPRITQSDPSTQTPDDDVSGTEDPPAPSKAIVKLDPSIPLPRSAEERAERRNARETEERAERLARITDQISVRLKERDTNGDGLLSREEVAGPFSGRFDDVDTNGDGQLDDAEQAAMIQELSERMRSFGDRGRRDRRGPPGDDRRFRDP